MRLNFSGVGEADIREGVRRIGEVVREQIELYERLTGSHAARGDVAALPEPAPAEPDAELADVLHLPPPASSSKLEASSTRTRRRRDDAEALRRAGLQDRE
jgi:2-aminoadipate transaminase